MQQTSVMYPSWLVLLVILLGLSSVSLAAMFLARKWSSGRLPNWTVLLVAVASSLVAVSFLTFSVRGRYGRTTDIVVPAGPGVQVLRLNSEVHPSSRPSPIVFETDHGLVRVIMTVGVTFLLVFGIAAVLRNRTLLIAIPPQRPAPGQSEARESSIYGWLVVPAMSIVVLGYLARPALLPSADSDLHRQSAAFAEQQTHTEKVLRELLETSASTGSDRQQVPDWLKNRVLNNGQFLLSSGQYSSEQEAESELLPHAAYLLQRAFQENHPWEGTWTVPMSQVRERVIENRFVEHRPITTGKFTGQVYRVHMRVDVSPAVCETFTTAWKTQIVQHRLQVLGVLFAWLTSLFFAATFYFRRAAHPENVIGWWSQLKMSAVTLSLTAAAVWVLVDVVR